jgi:hypothetical protein
MARTAVVAGTATAVSGRVARRQRNRWAEQDQAQYAQAPPPPVAAPPPATASPQGSEVDELRQLAELKSQGILTEEEFAAKKRQILGI